MAANDTLYVDAGATFIRQYVYKNPDGSLFDLTGWTAKVQVREQPQSADKIFEVIPTIDIVSAMISMTFSATQTALLVKPMYVWAMELTNAGSGVVQRLVEGQIINSLEVVK